MQAVTLTAGELVYHSNYPKPITTNADVLVRVSLAGICATDLELRKGYIPDYEGIPGHEFVGVVDAPQSSWHGRRVVGGINIGCGTCATCRRDGPEHCPNRSAIGIHNWDGVFADYVRVPTANLHAVPDSVPDETAVFTEPLAAALRIREQVNLRPSWRTAVVGPGRLGLLVAQVLALTGGDVVVLGRRQVSLVLPASLGMATGITHDYDDNSFDLVVDATGNEGGLAQALRLVRPQGTLVLKSTFAGTSTINLTKLVVSEVNVVGSRCGPFAPALRLLARQAVQVQPFITQTFPLHEAAAAFALAKQPGVVKVLLRP